MDAIPPLPPVLPDTAPPGDPRIPLLPAWRFAARHRHLTIPAVGVPAGFLAAGAAAAAFHQPVDTAIAGAGALLAVHLKAPHKWDRAIEQWYARASAAAAGGWLTAVSITGLNWPEVAALGAGALAWGFPFWHHKRPRGRRLQGIVAIWDEWWRHYAVNWDLAGSEVIAVRTKGVIDTLRVQLPPGKKSVRDVEQMLHLLESALRGHVAPRMTRAEADPKDPSQILIHLKRKNPHNVEVKWDGELAPSSVSDLMPIGRGEDGQIVFAPMLQNWFVIGRLRSGKSNELSVFLASITGCRDAALPWIVDLKGGRSARPWQPAAGWIATTIEEARLLTRCGVAEVRARARDAYSGEEQNVPTPDVPMLPIIIDEAHGVTSDMSGDTECRRNIAIIASEGGAVNVQLIILTQYGALSESVGTEQIRGNLPARMCFAVSQADHGQFVLPDYAKLDASRLENKGEFYWRLGADGSSAPCRGPHMPHPLVRQIAARNGALPRPPLILFATEWQETFDTRHERLPEAFRHSQEADVIPIETPEQAAARIEAELQEVPDAPAPPQPLPPDDVLADEMTRRKQEFARLVATAPTDGIAPKQLRSATGFARSWIQRQLADLAERGVVTRVSDGHYRGASAEVIWEAMETIRKERAQFDAEAREKVSA